MRIYNAHHNNLKKYPFNYSGEPFDPGYRAIWFREIIAGYGGDRQ